MSRNVAADSEAGTEQPFYVALVDLGDAATPRTVYGACIPRPARTHPACTL